MFDFLGITQKNRCKLCKDHRYSRECPRVNKNICYRCCNKMRIKMDCPQSCKYVIQQDSEKEKLKLNNYSECLAEQQHLLNLALEEWVKTENPIFNNKSPKIFSQTEEGKKRINRFFKKHENQLTPGLNYNHARKILSIPSETKLPDSYEDVASRFLSLIADYDMEKSTKMLVNHEIYKDKKYLKNYIKRNMSIRQIKAISEFEIMQSGISKHRDEAVVEFDVNNKYLISIVLKRINGRWLIDKKVLGEAGLVVSEKDHLQMAAYHYKNRNFAKAADKTKRFLKLYPDSADFHYYLGLYYSTQKKLEKAKQEYFHAMELDPNFLDPKYNYAFLFHAEGKMEKAKKIYEDILKEKKDVKTLNNLAVIYEQEGELEDAAVLLKKALRINPKFEEAKKNLKRLKNKLNENSDIS